MLLSLPGATESRDYGKLQLGTGSRSTPRPGAETAQAYPPIVAFSLEDYVGVHRERMATRSEGR
jgi:hypothetical protein